MKSDVCSLSRNTNITEYLRLVTKAIVAWRQNN